MSQDYYEFLKEGREKCSDWRQDLSDAFGTATSKVKALYEAAPTAASNQAKAFHESNPIVTSGLLGAAGGGLLGGLIGGKGKKKRSVGMGALAGGLAGLGYGAYQGLGTSDNSTSDYMIALKNLGTVANRDEGFFSGITSLVNNPTQRGLISKTLGVTPWLTGSYTAKQMWDGFFKNYTNVGALANSIAKQTKPEAWGSGGHKAKVNKTVGALEELLTKKTKPNPGGDSAHDARVKQIKRLLSGPKLRRSAGKGWKDLGLGDTLRKLKFNMGFDNTDKLTRADKRILLAKAPDLTKERLKTLHKGHQTRGYNLPTFNKGNKPTSVGRARVRSLKGLGTTLALSGASYTDNYLRSQLAQLDAARLAEFAKNNNINIAENLDNPVVEALIGNLYNKDLFK